MNEIDRWNKGEVELTGYRIENGEIILQFAMNTEEKEE